MNPLSDKLHEECAVFGASLKTPNAASVTYNGLIALQHRGQEAAGIAIGGGNDIKVVKDLGLVAEVFGAGEMKKLEGSYSAIGHTRYSTTGCSSAGNVQPFFKEYLTGRIAVAHNGNITNSDEIRNKLENNGVHFSASSDSEAIASLIAYYSLCFNSATKGVVAAASELKGAFCLVVIAGDGKLIAVRDPNGYRPLCIGKSEDGIIIASETSALDTCGFELIRDVKPGEVIVVENGEIVDSSIQLYSDTRGICIFEYIYFARPDSIIDGLSVFKARFEMGRRLARECPVEADCVCGVPDSGLEAAMGYAFESGLPYVTGFNKNRYIGRSFIFPSQAERANAVKMKLNPVRYNVEGKRIVVCDDSIVRGTTGVKMVNLLRHAGAKEVHLRISSPPFIHTCYYGTDIGDESNLVANRKTVDEIRECFNADTLGYISLEGLLDACKGCNLPFCIGCFNGEYGQKVEK